MKMLAVLVTFLLLWTDTIVKITYKEKHLTGSLFIISEDEYMSIMVGNMVASSRHGARAVDESLRLIHKYKVGAGLEGGKDNWK